MATTAETREITAYDRDAQVIYYQGVHRGRTEESPSILYFMVKRVFDFSASLAASALLIVPAAVIAAAIAVKDFGSPFFRQKRVGKDGSPLYIYKFRTMKNGADILEKTLTPEQLAQYHKEYKLDDDPRLIGYQKKGDGARCFGAKLRRMSIDELPQIFFNICLRGNMSLVGPRPILESELEENYTPAERKLLLSVKPGLTGYWQAYARNEAGYENHRRQDMELYYIRNRSLWMDVKILFKTVETVLRRRGAK